MKPNVRTTVAAIFLTAIALGMACEMPDCARALLEKRGDSVRKRIAAVRSACLTAIPGRMGLVQLNGAFVRLIGQHACNDVVRMGADDILSQPNPKRVQMKRAVRNMKRFAGFCESNGVAFAYVQLPKKLDADQVLLPPDRRDAANANVEDLLSGLSDQNVPFVDWRLEFAATPEDVAKNFYRTDHHWNTDASFRATGMLIDEICRRCRVSDSSAAAARRILSAASWKRKVLPGCFLGSLGKRTGPYFAGCDDVVVLKPKFDTELLFEVPSKRIKVRGSFKKTMMRRSGELETVDDRFVSDAYSLLYVGGLYPYARSVNPKAPLDLTVMLIGDSYVRPISAFAATAVRELIMVDPRRRGPSAPSLAELVRRRKPDIVLQVLNPSSLPVDRMTGRKTGRKIMFEYGLRRR